VSAREEPDYVTRDFDCDYCGGDGSLFPADSEGEYEGEEGVSATCASELEDGEIIRCLGCGLYYKITPDGLIPSGPWAPEKGK
jgi:hypothetical protein